MNDVVFAVLKVLLTVSSLCIYLSPVPIMRRMASARSTGETQLLPFVCMFVNSYALTLYGLFNGDVFPVAVTTVCGVILAVIYISIFAKYTSDKRQVARFCAFAAVPVALFTVYASLAWAGVTHQSSSSTATVFGYITQVTTVSFFSSPFATIRKVLREKSAASIPIELCAVSTVCNGFWTAYGFIMDDLFLIVPNAVCVLVGVAQIVLYAKYPPTAREDDGLPFSVALSPKSGATHSPSFSALRSPLEAVSSSKPCAV